MLALEVREPVGGSKGTGLRLTGTGGLFGAHLEAGEIVGGKQGVRECSLWLAGRWAGSRPRTIRGKNR